MAKKIWFIVHIFMLLQQKIKKGCETQFLLCASSLGNIMTGFCINLVYSILGLSLTIHIVMATIKSYI